MPEELGKSVELVLPDLRGSGFRLVSKWLRLGCGAERVQWYGVAGDALMANSLLRTRFDVVTIMGSSMPHFTPWEAVRLFAAIREVQPRHGLLVVEQADVAGWILLNN